MTYHPGAAAFEGVATLIAGAAPPAFLATVLAEAAGGIAAAARDERNVPLAEEMRDRLEQVKKAARVLAGYMHDPHTLGRLDRASIQSGGDLEPVDLSGKADWLHDLVKRSDAAKAAVTAEQGKEAWPSPEGLTGAETCALVVARLWQAVRGRPAGPQSGKVRAACNAMWEACGQEPLGMDEGVWRRRVELARSVLDDPALATGEAANSPERQMRQHAMTACNRLAQRLIDLAQEQARRECVAKAQERVAQLGLKH